MSLLTSYQARHSTQQRTEWSNPQNSSATSPNTTLEGLAATDASADFQVLCGISYDDTVAIHVAAAVPLVIGRLKLYNGQSTDEQYEKIMNRMEKWYRLVLGRNRITPQSDSTLSPTTETSGGKPFADLGIWTKAIPGAPGGGGGLSDNRPPRLD